MVRRRHVYHVAGYDPMDAGRLYRRFTRQLDVFRRTWSVDASVSALEQAGDKCRAWWTVRSRGTAPVTQTRAVKSPLPVARSLLPFGPKARAETAPFLP